MKGPHGTAAWLAIMAMTAFTAVSAFAQEPPADDAAAATDQPATDAQPDTDAATTPEAKEDLPEVEVIQQDTPPPQPPPQPQPQVTQVPDVSPEPVAAPEAEPVVEAPTDTAGPAPGNTPVQMSPVSGSEIPLAKVPSGVSVVSPADIERDGTRQLQNALQQNVPGVFITDTAGSGFRTDVQYRGFDASPVGGRSQALAVYQNGVRINEAFGDIVNFDAIPVNAIHNITVTSNNPAFGLNAVGGAIAITMKNGFLYQGSEIDVMAGSYGRKQIAAQTGGQVGSVGAYLAVEGLKEDGFRDFSDAEVRRMYADLGFKGSAVELHFNFTAARSIAGVVTAAPVEILAVDWNRTFTSPQDTEFEVWMPSINASVQATETLTLSAVGYYRHFKQNVLDGNLSEAEECTGAAPGFQPPGFLCITEFEGGPQEEPLEDANGNPIAFDFANDVPGSIERINQEAESYGVTLEAVEKARLFGRPNQLLIGGSYDHGEVSYSTSSEVGVIGPRFVVDGLGLIAVEPEDVAPRLLDTENTYWGVYFSDTLDVTDELAVTVGGRYNHATIKLTDLTGDFPGLNATNEYERFNPMVGATYKVLPGVSVYGGYSEANRAPTAAELGCAEPDNPCLIESFLTDDPPLEQVVSHTWEAGIRGEHKSYDGQRLSWSLGYFRTLNTDDILNVAAEETGRGFFLNGGDTLRQGIEAAIGYNNARLSAYAAYTYVEATFEDNIVLPAPATPSGTADCPDLEPGGFDPAEPPQCNFVQSGDELPGIPDHRFKAGFNYYLTPKWQFGADMVAASGMRFFGDEANNHDKIGGHTRVDLHTSYDVNDNVQVYGFVKNVFDRRYGLYGTFFEAEEADEAFEAAGYDEPENGRSITPAPPVSAYGGVRMKF